MVPEAPSCRENGRPGPNTMRGSYHPLGPAAASEDATGGVAVNEKSRDRFGAGATVPARR